MDYKNILRIGYFDRILLTGANQPIITNPSIEVVDESSFKDCLEVSKQSFKNGLATLRIELLGECDNNIAFAELERMRDERNRMGLKRVDSTKKYDRYLIAYIDITILKSNYAMPFELRINGKTEEDMIKVAKSEDTLELLVASLELVKFISEKYNYSEDCISIAIVDKIYIYNSFRRNGIATWLHSNLPDIINTYAMQFPNGIILSYGDFAGEAETIFNMSHDAYAKMLIKHYKNLGYKNKHIIKFGKSPKIADSILYKILL